PLAGPQAARLHDVNVLFASAASNSYGRLLAESRCHGMPRGKRARMRVLLTRRPLWSHLLSTVVPVAPAHQEAGHRRSGYRRHAGQKPTWRIKAFGIAPHVRRITNPTGPAGCASYRAHLRGLPLPKPARIESGAKFGRLFAGVSAVPAAQDLVTASSNQIWWCANAPSWAAGRSPSNGIDRVSLGHRAT